MSDDDQTPPLPDPTVDSSAGEIPEALLGVPDPTNLETRSADPSTFERQDE
jgi:hypothetical protein